MFIKVVKQSTSDVTAINVSEIASVGDCKGDVVSVYMKNGDQYWVRGSYDEVLLLARGFVKLFCVSPNGGEAIVRVDDINWVRQPLNKNLSAADFCDMLIGDTTYLTVGMPMNKLRELL
ncbi:MAG: hypothetical protein ACRDC4_03795 [Plesiomonas sp.]